MSIHPLIRILGTDFYIIERKENIVLSHDGNTKEFTHTSTRVWQWPEGDGRGGGGLHSGQFSFFADRPTVYADSYIEF